MRPSRRLTPLALALALACAACGSDAATPADTTDTTDTAPVGDTSDTSDTSAPLDTTDTAPLPDATALPGPTIRFDPSRPDFFAAPVPALDLFAPPELGGHPDLAAWPRDAGGFVDGLVTLAEHTSGASLAGAVYFTFDAPPPDPENLHGLLVDVDPTSSERGRVRPTLLHYEPDGGPYGAPHLVSLLPHQGLALRPKTRYLALLMSRAALTDAGLGRPAALADLLAGRPVPALEPHRDAYLAALTDALAHATAAPSRAPLDPLDPAKIVGLTAFSTADPVSELGDFLAAARAEPAPDPSALTLVETHERFCVYTSTITLPDYQSGPPPFSNPGEGTWQRDDDGSPLLARRAPSRLFLTLPRTPAPASGYPVVVFIRTGGGGDRPLIDRGPRAERGGDPIVPTGSGPAMNLAAAGWAGLTWDGPHGGPRNPGGADEQFLMFNVLNPAGTRDNIRQTALEAVLITDLVASLAVDPAPCPGATAPEAAATTLSRFDPTRVALMGHSMGGWIAPIAMAYSDGIHAAILSGAGGSWIANIVYKRSPLDVRPLAEQLLGYTRIDRALTVFDPALTLLQWAGEAADPQSHGAAAMTPPRHVLMIEGIVDTYILPPIANTTALSLGLDLAGDALDATDPRLTEFTPLADLLPLAGRAALPLPVTANRDERTAVVVQALGDAIEDGHEAMFQTPGPKHQYRCFLETFATAAAPTVVVPGDGPDAEWAPCQ